MHAVIRCPQNTLSTDIWPMEINSDTWVYNRVPDIQSGLSATGYGQGQSLIQFQKPLSTVMFGVVQKYVLGPKL